MCPHILCFGLIVSDRPGGVLRLLGFFLYMFFSFCFFLVILEGGGGGGGGVGQEGEGSFNSAGIFPNRFIIINLQMLFPSLKASRFIIATK